MAEEKTESKHWHVKSVEDFERFTPNPGAPLPKIITTSKVANEIRQRGHGGRFALHEVEVSDDGAPHPSPVAQAAPEIAAPKA